MKTSIKNKDIFKIFPKKRIKFECGIEQEMLLIAISKKDKAIYNLNLACCIVDKFNFFISSDRRLKKLFSSGWSMEKEYSKCLLEIISPPYKKVSANTLFKENDYINKSLNRHLQKFLFKFYPQIDRSFFCKLEINGTSEVNKYIDAFLKKSDDTTSPEHNVLLKNIDFVLKNNQKLINLGEYKEPAIGIYSHLSSFHLTFHPTYSDDEDNNIKKYLNFLFCLPKTIEAFKHLDIGNRKLVRNGKIIVLEDNLRDIFLDVLAKKIYKQPRQIKLTGNSYAQKKFSFLKMVDEIIQKSNSPKKGTFDQIFKSWNCADFRPRIINNKIPGFEIRAFGSSFSKKGAKLLLEHLILLDDLL